jgi:hypothetical protein
MYWRTNLNSRKLTIYLPDNLAKSLRIACVNQETTLSSVFADLAESYVAQPFMPKNRDRRKTRKKKSLAI